MLQLLLFSVVSVLFLVALLEVILRFCIKNEKGTWRRCIIISAPVQTITNKVRGIKMLKEEVEEKETTKQPNIQVETV